MTGSIAHRTLTSPRIPALAGIVALHLLIAYLLLTAFVQRPTLAPPMRTTVSFVADPAPPVPPPPLQRGPTTSEKFTKKVWVPEPPVIPPPPVEAPAPSDPVGATGPVTPPPAELLRLIGKNWLPNSQDYYPPDLIRSGVQGNAQVRVCVD